MDASDTAADRSSVIGRMSTSAGGGEHGVRDHVLLLQDVKQARQTDGDADAGQGLVRIIPREVVIASAGADAADLGMVEQDGLVHRAGVVIETARDREVELEVLLRDAERGQVAHDGAQLIETGVKDVAAAAVLLEEGELIRARARAGDKAQDLIRLLDRDAAGIGEQLAHLVRADLVELVNGAQHIARLLAQAEDGEKSR